MRILLSVISGLIMLLVHLSGFAQDFPTLKELLDNSPREEKIIKSYIGEIKNELSRNFSQSGSSSFTRDGEEQDYEDESHDFNIEDEGEEEERENILDSSAESGEKSLSFQEIFKDLEPINNKLVRFFVKYYTTVGRAYLVRSVERMQEYFPIVKKYAEEIGLPLEVAVFGIIESGYVADALSHKGARGIWQLMPLTAKIYDLRMNSYIDERMDVEKSTRAAFLYIKSLSEMFNKNWALILASYNGGGGYISNQIRKHKESDFWKLCQITGFKSETLEFVPRFYAVLHILKNPSAYQLEFPKFNSKIRFDRIKVPRNLKFSLLSKYTSIPEHILEELNPHLKKSIALKNSHLFVPSNMGKMVKSKIKAYWKQKRYVANKKQARRSRYKIVRYRIKTQDTLSEIARRYGTSTSKILRYNRGRIKSASRIYKGMVIRVPVKKGYQVKKRRNRTIVYTVKNGDTLYKIARQYQVSVETLKQANSLRNHVIYKGQTIRIPLSRTGYSRATHRKKKSWTVYRVKSGDTLSGIARKYRVSVREIKKKNGLSGNMIRKGQEIRIPQEVIVYKVRKGDTLSELAQKFQISIRKIVSMNDLSSRQMLAAGRTLLIPGES